MNKLITTQNGGFPLDLDDLRWIDDGIREAFEGLSKAWTNYYIISGVTVTTNGGNKECTEGFAVIDGEICYVPAQTVAIPSPAADHDWVIQLKQTFDTDGNETFQNGSSYDTYAIRQGELAYADISKPPSGTKTKHTEYLPAEDYKTLKGLITESVYDELFGSAEDWTDLSLESGWSATTLYTTITGDPRYRIEFGRVKIEGSVEKSYGGGSIASPQNIAVLPAGYRPTKDIVLSNQAHYDGTSEATANNANNVLIIRTSGEIEYRGATELGTKVIVDLNIPPFIPA